MKAFLSETHEDTIVPPHAFADLDEARAILAETEPPSPVSYYGQAPGCYTVAEGAWCSSCLPPEARGSLAESLAAFIALDIR